MKNSLGWGILATGGIAETFTRDLQIAGLNVVAVGSRTKAKASAFAEQFGLSRAYGSYQELVNDPDVDIIYIATPHPQHIDTALLALKAGKHVLVEKPFTLNADESRTLVRYADEHNLVILEAMWTRFLPHMRRIHEIIHSGALGILRSVSAEHRQFLPTDPKHRLNALELGGGALLDLGIYPISFAVDILGAPVAIEAIARFKDTGVDAETATIMHHENDAISTTVSALDCTGINQAVINGSEARIVIDSVWYTATSFRLEDYAGNIIEEFNQTVDGRGMQFQAFEMERLVNTGGKSTIMSPDESIVIMETLDTVRKHIGLVYPVEE
ncbi:Gfo/Idh/MocA family oxidoreductase [uncultured Cedecea sp.]|uniref:Gfo/Idh/MocA family protein n=1 Tax=uncultured Cedecea sp. TaxID=988762 RepID=UPI00263387B9|nr:Gfo/Idh/MocA family oxidoreductase [uncultured Cedecea sp.]